LMTAWRDGEQDVGSVGESGGGVMVRVLPVMAEVKVPLLRVMLA